MRNRDLDEVQQLRNHPLHRCLLLALAPCQIGVGLLKLKILMLLVTLTVRLATINDC